MEPLLYHLVPTAEWTVASDPYAPDSIATEGFVHCSTAAQVAGVAQNLFAGRDDLLLLHIDPARLRGELRWEDCYDHGQAFPHLYAPLDHDAVVAVTPYGPDRDGRFTPPVP
jgi:uncharacterized protein (DUF952 family)